MTRRGFAGCVDQLSLSLENQTSLASIDLALTASTHSGVSFTGCHQLVVPGLRMLDAQSYAHVTLDSSTINTVQFDLLTNDVNGVLLYSRLGEPSEVCDVYSTHTPTCIRCKSTVLKH